MNVEIKSFPDSPPGLVETVLDAIERTGDGVRVLLSSFDHRDLVRVRGLLTTSTDRCGPYLSGHSSTRPSPAPSPISPALSVRTPTMFRPSASGSESVAYRRNPSPSRSRR